MLDDWLDLCVTNMAMRNIATLLQAAEFIERRDRGNPVVRLILRD